MVAKLVTFFALVAAASAGVVPGIPIAKVAYAEPEAPAQYQYTYSVQDSHTGDIKQQQEAREGDAVHGSYSLVQPDGVTRIVEYTSDAVHGFNANVRYEGAPVAAAPIAKVAYAPAPVAKIAYAAAPVAKVAYAAPVAKVAYAPAPAAYAPAPISYAPAPVTYAQAPSYAPAPVAYASAPVAKVAYATAPVAKYAYTANLGQVSFNSPVVSYHH